MKPKESVAIAAFMNWNHYFSKNEVAGTYLIISDKPESHLD
jgi:hypothetical protein